MAFFSLLILFFCLRIANSVLVDYISPGLSLTGNQTIVSKSGIFELGFFKPNESEFYYIGIWYRNITIQTVVWVANTDYTDYSIRDPSLSEFKISEEGDLVLLDQFKGEVWSSQIYSNYSSTMAVLLDTGNLVLTNGSDSSSTIWQSFDYPTDTWLPGAKLMVSKFTNKTQLFTSWGYLSDPSPGGYSFQLSLNPYMQDPDLQDCTVNILSNTYESESEIHYREVFLESDFGIELQSNEHSTYFTYSSSSLSRIVIDYLGQITKEVWLEDETKWLAHRILEPLGQCQDYYPCWAFGSCNLQQPPYCACLPGFKTNSTRASTGGECVRTNPLISCDINRGYFLEIPFTKFPSNASYSAAASDEDCRLACLNNCSCTAYAYNSGLCFRWLGELWNMQLPINDEEPVNGSFYLLLQHQKNSMEGRYIYPIVGALSGILILSVIVLMSTWRCRRRHTIAESMEGEDSLVVYKYRDLKKATKKFSQKLGGGSFGSVFKGALPNSTSIAVKRLEGFRQGEKQFRSEVSTIGIIQHVNLLRLQGFCSEGTKKLLVYDYMKYGSLDNHLFHHEGSEILDWKTRFQVAIGTAKGLAYLHEECRECIIHCDIKPENILLDADFQPKVADFGMAKLLGREFSRVLTTMRGTIGYLAPEWISGSAITPKADVYSYGMMLLEIISGRRNTSKFGGGNVRYFPVWAAAQLNEGEVLSLLDCRLEGNADLEELTRACKVACWCIQDDEAHRPSMGKVVRILEGVVEVNIPPIPTRLLNLTGDQEDTVFFLDSPSIKVPSHTNAGGIRSLPYDHGPQERPGWILKLLAYFNDYSY